MLITRCSVGSTRLQHLLTYLDVIRIMALPLHVPIAMNMRQASMWAEHNLERALAFCKGHGRERSVECFASTCHGTTLSTCFSGTGGAELSAQAECQALAFFSGCSLEDVQFRTLWACESNKECQIELQMLPHPPECIFTDVTHTICDKILPTLRGNAKTMRYADLQKIMKHPVAARAVMPKGSCVKHPGRCCRITQADLHAAGTECPAWSSAGLKEGCSGDRVLAWVAWVIARRKMQESVIFHENVDGFPFDAAEG